MTRKEANEIRIGTFVILKRIKESPEQYELVETGFMHTQAAERALRRLRKRVGEEYRLGQFTRKVLVTDWVQRNCIEMRA